MPTVTEIFESMEYGPAPESAAAAFDWIAEHSSNGQFGLFIDGGFREPASHQHFETVNPATGKTLAQIAQGSAEDIDAAVSAANNALSGWKALGDHGRAKFLYAFARGLQKHARLFAVLETIDNGKPIRESRDIDIPLAIRHFYHHAGWAQLLDIEMPGYEGIGVVGQIVPWNFPLLMLAWKVAPALAAGCTVVLKPAEDTPLTALLFAHLCIEVGLPAGVVNIVTGDGSTGEALVNHPGVKKIAFTGSTEVGRAIRIATAGSGKKLSLELGGKSPFVVFQDADLDAAVEGIVDSIYFNQGQVCCAGSRLLVQEAVGPRLLEKLRTRMAKLRLGDPLDKTTDVGTIVSPRQLARITDMVEAARSEGAEVFAVSESTPSTGCYYPPTLITNVSPSFTIVQEEVFGPVLVASTFRTPCEAVELANNTRYGLAASIWTENINLALDIAPKIRAGTVWINCANIFDAGSGFGGYRESGFGREGGREGMYEYLVSSASIKHRGANTRSYEATATSVEQTTDRHPSSVAIDRTPKLFIGGKQVRPDSGYSSPILDANGELLGHVGEGSRKDIRNAVEAARAAAGWASSSAHLRAQILYYLAENLNIRFAEFSERIRQQTEWSAADADNEVQKSIERIFTFAAFADKYEGAVHPVPMRGVTLAMPEPMGIIGIICPQQAPLLGLISAVLPAIAMGNTVVVVPSSAYPLSATDLYQVLETSDLPAGVINIVTGDSDTLATTLASHDEVAAVWYSGTAEGAMEVERLSASNLKRTWTHTDSDGWLHGDGHSIAEALRQATQIKNVWVPYGA